jgi:hypothetical protein
MTSKPIKRYGASYPIGPEPDWSFLKDYAAEDSDEPEPETPEALRERLRQEVLAELSAKLATPKEATPVATPKAKVIRNEGYNEFFELLEVEREARRRRGH